MTFILPYSVPWVHFTRVPRTVTLNNVVTEAYMPDYASFGFDGETRTLYTQVRNVLNG